MNASSKSRIFMNRAAAAVALIAGAILCARTLGAPGSGYGSPPVGAAGAGKNEAGPVGPPPPRTSADEVFATLQNGVDVTSYFLDLTFDPTNESVGGTVTIAATSLSSSLQTLVLDLAAHMGVSSVKKGSLALSFTHTSDLLVITLDRTYAVGETFQVKVTYSGIPTPTGLGSIGWNKYP